MKILSLGLDNSILNKNSSLSQRTVEYGNLVEKYTVIVPCEEDKKVVLSERARVVGIGSCNKIIAFFKIYKIAKKILNKEKYNIITVQDQYYLAFIGFLLSKKFRIGFEIQVHGFEKYYGLRKMITKFVLPRANAVRVVSQRLKKRMVDEFGVDEKRITVAPIFSELSITNYELRIKNKDDNRFIFLTVGRLVLVKNIEMQIKAMANYELRITNYELWVVGDGLERKKLKAISKKLGVEKNIKFLGWQDDLDKFYRQADAFLLTSNSEGWGMAVIEAGSYGLPIIMTDVGCAGEIIKDGESGLVIPVGDQGRLEESMLKLIQDEDLRNRLGKNARQAVMNLPSKEQILELYKKSWGKACKIKSL